MKVGDFVNIVKRQGRYGTTGNNTEQATTDILNLVNIFRKRIWRKWDWPWALEPISFQIASGTILYAVQTASGNLIARIKLLVVTDATVSPPTYSPMVQIDMERYYQWRANNASTPAIPKEYFLQGQNSSGQFLITVWPAPSSALTIGGFGKKLLTTYTSADVVANTTFDYFPDGVIEDVLLDFVLGGVAEIQGQNADSIRYRMAAERKLGDMLQDELAQIDDDSEATTPPPDYYIFLKRGRGGITEL